MNDIIITLAKAAILISLNQPVDFDLNEILKKYPQLKENGATFVTINTLPGKQLRGCIGSLQAYRPLYEDIIANAQSAALRDPRFKPLSVKELQNIKIEVSILSKPKTLPYTDIDDLKKKITPFEDGVVLNYQNSHATYLPQVWDQLPNFSDFFNSLCMKANLPESCLELHPDISIYQVKKYEE
jgi:AmmeMemoRadiSam system protein A